MNILITGGAGYISSILIKTIKESEIETNITVIDNYYNNTEKKSETSLKYKNTYNIKYIRRNINDVSKYINELPETIDVLINMASLNSRKESDNFKQKYLEENFIYLNNFLLRLESEKLIPKKIILTSTRGVYGNSLNGEHYETDIPSPISYYGYTKLLQENAVKIFSKENNVDTYIFRLGNVFGKHQSKFYSNFGIIPMLSKKIIKNEKIVLNANGSLIRDFIHVDDITKIIYQSIRKKDYNNNIKTFNLGTGFGHTLKELTELMATSLNKQLDVEYVAFSNDIHSSILNIKKLRNEFEVGKQESILEFIKSKEFIYS